MKNIFLPIVCLLLSVQGFAQVQDSLSSEKNIREKILSDIRDNLSVKNKTLDSTIVKLDMRVDKIDSIIKITGNPKERMDKLVERVQILEDKQKALEQNELNIYQANYQSAIINLASMDREIKPLILFHATKDFFNTLTETSNPDTYEGYQKSFDKFKTYVEHMKTHDATLNAISKMIEVTGNISFGSPLTAPYSQLLFSGMAKYVNSIGHRKRELKKEAEKMFTLTATLSQFTADKNLIEYEWEGITQSLGEMQTYYDTVLDKNLGMINASRIEFTFRFAKQSDANIRYQYLTMLRQKAADYVLATKEKNPKDWKGDIYYQLMDVQSLKMKYGDITYRIRQHIDKYDALVSKYKSNEEIGTHVAKLERKLNQLKETFDGTFEPEEYVHTASRMYKVM